MAASLFTPDMIKEYNIIPWAQLFNQHQFYELLVFLDDYYHNHQSLVSDIVYDQLLNNYQQKFGSYNKIGSTPRTNVKTALPYHLGSLRKIKEQSEINNWIAKYNGPYLIEDKIDGATLLYTLTIINGQKVHNLYTRGDGNNGLDVSHLLAYLNLPKLDMGNSSSQKNPADNLNLSKLDMDNSSSQNIPADNLNLQKLDMDNSSSQNILAVRGEIVMTNDSFHKLGKEYKNPRNMTSGLINAKDSLNPTLVSELKFYAYRIMNSTDKPSIQMDILKSLGFLIPNTVLTNNISQDFLTSHMISRKQSASYDIDGLVVYNDHFEPFPANENPRHVVAFKMETDIVETVVIEVQWNASKDMLLKPRVHYQTVHLSGADLSHASGYNARFIVDNEIGPGAVIRLTQIGDIIPTILSVITPSVNGPQWPNKDDGQYGWNENGVELVLTMPSKQVIVKRLNHFLTTIGVQHFGGGRLKILVDAGLQSIDQLIRLQPHMMTSLPGIGQITSEQLCNDMQVKLNGISLDKLLTASGFFPGIGQKRFEALLQAYPQLLSMY